MMYGKRQSSRGSLRSTRLPLQLASQDWICEGIVEGDQYNTLLAHILHGIVSEARAHGVVLGVGHGIGPLFTPAGVNEQDVTGKNASLFQSLGFEHALNIRLGNPVTRSQPLAFTLVGLCIKQQPAGNDGGNILYAELEE